MSSVREKVHEQNGEAEQFPFGQNAPTESGDTETEAPDPFDPESLRLSPDLSIGLGVKKAVTTVPVRKPAKEWWIRTHPDDGYRLETAVIELKEDREVYLVAPSLRGVLATESTLSPRALVATMNRQGVLTLWPIKIPGADGRLDEWSRSALDAAERARKCWVRVQANMSLGAYERWTTEAPVPEPEWPDLTFREILKIAFRDKFITALDHPVIKKLRGES
jgi:hypothetical protein